MAGQGGPFWKRLLWFAILWTAGVLVLAAIAYLIRWGLGL